VWLFHNTKEEFNPSEIDDKVIGFVYIITHIPTGKKYIGKKLLTRAKTRQVKGKKKKFRVESDWRDYWGSNQTLAEEVKHQGEQNYTREILHLCTTRSELSYWETWEIFVRHALLTDSYYNLWVTCKIHKTHVIGKIDGKKNISE
jgi:hypothetical protein